MRNLLKIIPLYHSFGSVYGLTNQKLIDMTDIDFRRFASLLFALHFLGVKENPIKDAVKAADELLIELQHNE